MNENDFVRLLQFDRHDLMNDLQVIQGYLSIDKIEMVKDKIDHMISNHHKERKLIHLNAPHFTFLMLQVNHLHQNIRLDYEIDLKEMSLQVLDKKLVKLAHFIINAIKDYGDESELYHLNIILSEEPSDASLIFQCIIAGHFPNEKGLKTDFEQKMTESPFNFVKNENSYLCKFIFNTLEAR